MCPGCASSALPSASRRARARSGRAQLEEAADDADPLGLGRPRPRHRVEQLVAVDAAERGAVGAADVVREDLQARDRVGGAPLSFDRSRLRFSWYAFVFWACSSTRIILRHTVRALSRSAPLNAKSLVVFGADVLLEGVVVEVLRRVREVRAVTRDVAPGPARSFWIRSCPSSSRIRRRPSRAPRRARRARDASRNATSRARGSAATRTRASRPAPRTAPRRRSSSRAPRESRSRTPRSARTAPPRRRRAAAAKQRAVVDRVRDLHVQRLLQHHAPRHDDQQAILPQRRVVRCELLLPADQLVQPRVRLVESCSKITPSGALGSIVSSDSVTVTSPRRRCRAGAPAPTRRPRR